MISSLKIYEKTQTFKFSVWIIYGFSQIVKKGDMKYLRTKTGPVPDIEQLMEEWPDALQDNLRGFSLPDGPLDLIIDCACGLLDIPITNRVHGLHQLLTLYQAVNDTS